MIKNDSYAGDIIPQGQRHQRAVPDTLDLSDRARLAINGLGGIIDPACSYTSRFAVEYGQRTPLMTHGGADILCDPKILESLTMMRLMCGASQHMELESAFRNELFSRLKDGLYWNYADASRPWRASYSPMYDDRKKAGVEEDLCPVYGAGRMLRAMVMMYELDRDPAIESKIRELAEGLRRIAIDKGDYSYFPDGGYGEPFNYPRSGWIVTDEALSESEGGEGAVTAFQTAVLYALVKWYNASGDEQALDFAGRIARYCMLPKFWGGVFSSENAYDTMHPGDHKMKISPDPLGIAGHELGHWNMHFHTRAVTLRALLELGVATGNWRMKEFVRRGYEYTLTNGIARIGWISSGPNPFGNNIMEGCNIGDLAALGIRLSDAGMGDYWDDVDALVRNQMAEGQLTDADLMRAAAAASPAKTPEELKDLAGGSSTKINADNVIDRTVGLFAAHIKPVSVPVLWSAGCCNGNATQGLYYVWEGIVREQAGFAQVNLLLNRAAKSLDVDSYLPYEGKAVIHNKLNTKISVRIPAWVDRSGLAASVNGNPGSPMEMGNNLLFEDLKPGDEIAIEFPVALSEASYTAAYRTNDEQTYRCTFKGSTLVDISPRDDRPTSYPLYRRGHMQDAKVRFKDAECFIADRVIHGW
ncbi:MAG: hypothetical protein ACYC4R_04440 [Anaerolineae bacterium]